MDTTQTKNVVDEELQEIEKEAVTNEVIASSSPSKFMSYKDKAMSWGTMENIGTIVGIVASLFAIFFYLKKMR